MLAPDGKFAVLLPEPQSISFERQAEKNGLNIERQLFIFNTLPGRVFRIITLYSRSEPDGFELEELAIRDKDGNYTKHFTELLQPYYLFGETPEAYLPE